MNQDRSNEFETQESRQASLNYAFELGLDTRGEDDIGDLSSFFGAFGDDPEALIKFNAGKEQAKLTLKRQQSQKQE